MDLTPHLDQIGVMFVVFLASITVLNYLVFKPTLQILKERQKKMSGLEAEARQLEAEYTEKFAAYTKIIDEAKTSARAARDHILKTAEDEQKNVLTAARSNAEQLINTAKQTLSIQSGEARLNLRQSVQDLARNMVEKVLKRKAA